MQGWDNPTNSHSLQLATKRTCKNMPRNSRLREARDGVIRSMSCSSGVKQGGMTGNSHRRVDASRIGQHVLRPSHSLVTSQRVMPKLSIDKQCWSCLLQYLEITSRSLVVRVQCLPQGDPLVKNHVISGRDILFIYAFFIDFEHHRTNYLTFPLLL